MHISELAVEGVNSILFLTPSINPENLESVNKLRKMGVGFVHITTNKDYAVKAERKAGFSQVLQLTEDGKMVYFL